MWRSANAVVPKRDVRNKYTCKDHGVFVFPDTNAHFLGEKPQHLYSVRFAMRELWGDRGFASLVQ
jgi:hypothetical protein